MPSLTSLDSVVDRCAAMFRIRPAITLARPEFETLGQVQVIEAGFYHVQLEAAFFSMSLGSDRATGEIRVCNLALQPFMSVGIMGEPSGPGAGLNVAQGVSGVPPQLEENGVLVIQGAAWQGSIQVMEIQLTLHRGAVAYDPKPVRVGSSLQKTRWERLLDDDEDW